MTDRSDSEFSADQQPTEKKAEERELRGRAGYSSSGADAQADQSRSGADVGESIEIAEAGTKAQGDHSHPERAKTGEAPVEQVFNDPAMTGGRRVVTGSAKATGAVPPGPSPAEAGSGGAQSIKGARESDRLAAGEPPASGKPFDTGTEEKQ